MNLDNFYTIGGMYTYHYHNGRYADWGDYALQAAQLALNDINASKMLDKPLQMPDHLIEDYHCWPEHARTIAEKLLSQQILALTGVDCSGPAVHIADEAKKWKIPAISYGVNASEFTSVDRFPYFLRVVTPSDIFDGYLLVLAAHLNIKNLVFCHTNDAWGLGAKKVILEFAKKHGVTLDHIVEYERDTEVKDMITHIKPFKEKGYKNYLIIAPTPDTVTVFKAFHELDMNKEGYRIFAGEMISADEKPDAVYGSYGYIAPMTKLFDSDLLSDFTKRFQEFSGQEVDIASKAFAFAAISYDHIFAVAHGIKLMLDNNIHVTPQNLMDSIRKVDFSGVTGRVAFTKGTNDRSYMGVTFLNNQGYHEDGSVKFVPVGSLNPDTKEMTFEHDKVKWPGMKS